VSIKLKIDDSVVGGAANPCPAVSIVREAITHPVTGVLKAIKEVWTAKGVLLKKNGSLETQRATLEGLINAMTTTSTVLLDETGLTMTGTGSLNGMHPGLPSFPDGKGVEHATQLHYELRFECTYLKSGVTEWATWELTIDSDERGVESRSLSGEYFKPGSSDIKADCITYVGTILASDENYSRSESYAREGVSSGVYGKTCRFTVRDTGWFKVLPSGCSSANVTKTSRSTMNRPNEIVVSGTFVGKDGSMAGAQAAVDSLLAQYDSYPCLAKEISPNEYAGSISFSATFLETDENIVEYTEQMTIEVAFPDFVMMPILDGLPPYRQDTVWRSARAIQRGSLLARTPTPAKDPVWPLHLKERPQITNYTPDYDADKKIATYRIDWVYVFEFETTPAFPGFG